MAISPDIMAGRRPQVIDLAIPKVNFVRVEDPTKIPTELTGQKWLVTGVSRTGGIGIATARMAGLRGAEVFCTASSSHEAEALALIKGLTSEGINVHWKPFDLMVANSGRDLVKEAADTMGRLDVVVNNAGQTDDKATKELTTEEYTRALRIGILAPFEIKQEAADVMENQENWGGDMVDISSVARHGNMWQFAYSSVKAAIVAQNQSFSDEIARRRRIRFNSLEVGIVPGTAMTLGLKGNLIQRFVKFAGAENPVHPDEVAQAVIITASPDRSGKITRAILQVVGGENYDQYQIVPQ